MFNFEEFRNSACCRIYSEARMDINNLNVHQFAHSNPIGSVYL